MSSCFLDSYSQCPMSCAEFDPPQPIGICDLTGNHCQDTKGLESPKETCPTILTEEGKKKKRISETFSRIETSKICPPLSPFLPPKVPRTSPKAAEME